MEICGKECGSDPKSVVDYAIKRFRDDVGIDLCYCVIDRDEHDANRFSSALIQSDSENNKHSRRDFLTIISDPCIEFWFLLHYEFCRSPFAKTGAKTSSELVVDRLRKHLPEYDKVSARAISSLLELTDTAIQNAVKAHKDAIDTGEKNPSTSVYIVVDRLLAEGPTRE